MAVTSTPKSLSMSYVTEQLVDGVETKVKSSHSKLKLNATSQDIYDVGMALNSLQSVATTKVSKDAKETIVTA
jgi:hypothetical protein